MSTGSKEIRTTQFSEAWRQEQLRKREPDFSGRVLWASDEGIAFLDKQIQAALAEKERVEAEKRNAGEEHHDETDNFLVTHADANLTGRIPRRIVELRAKELKIVPFQDAVWFKQHNFRTITLGTRVIILASDSKEEETFDLLGPLEAEDHNRKILAIPFTAPIAKALLNHAPGETVETESKMSCRIIKIEQIVLPNQEPAS